MIPLVTGADVTFWICGPLMVLGTLGLVVFRKAAYAALSTAFAMLNLAAIYFALDAPFLGAVQIIVYTGAIMMLFLFVLMLVGVDTPDSVVETLRGQRIAAVIVAIGLFALIVLGIGGAITAPAVGLEAANAAHQGHIESLAALIFGRYVFAFEITSALLITAAVGAMVVAHTRRVHPVPGQAERAEARMKDYATKGTHPGSLPNSGVLARNNSIATPALLPDGSVAPESISQTLAGRSAVVDAPALSSQTAETFHAIERVAQEEEK
ncbi:MAG: NADH-quinone oxidoreductase subunit J [Propionicimonas sp.]|nr:NADH-quinone oxidoreductase subunit J [Propionicimonas sp.]